jgi:hypothetical protein
MHLERKQDLSIYYWLKDLFTSYPMVNVNDGYPEGELILPSVTILSHDIRPSIKQMGSRKSWRQRLWVIDVLGNNKAQRDEMTSVIIDQIEYGIPIYDYDEGFPPTVSPTELGLLRPTDWEVITVRIFPDLVEKMYWRNSIRFFTEYNAI